MDPFDLENPHPDPWPRDDRREQLLFTCEWQDSTLPLFGDTSIHTTALAFFNLPRVAFLAEPDMVYLATNYVDRFAANRTIPRDAGLCFLACLILAAKMIDPTHPLTKRELVETSGYPISEIKRMEWLVLRTLSFNMRAITPYAFTRFFLPLVGASNDDIMRLSASRIIRQSQRDVRMLWFRPSVVAAMAVITAAAERSPSGYPRFRELVSSCKFLDKEMLAECLAARRVAEDIARASSPDLTCHEDPESILKDT